MWSSCTLLHQTGTAVAMHIPPVVLTAFLHTPALNILVWKNPLRRYRPLPLHTLKISSRDHLCTPYPPSPHACWLFCLSACLALPPFTSCSDARRLLFFLSLLLLVFPSWRLRVSSLAFLPTRESGHLACKAASRPLQPSQLTTQTAKRPDQGSGGPR